MSIECKADAIDLLREYIGGVEWFKKISVIFLHV